MSLSEHDRPEFVGATLRRPRMVWTEAKNTRLKELCEQGVPYDLIAADLSIEFEESIGRESVRDRAWKLRLRRPPLSAWTPEIDAAMLQLTATGMTYHDAALTLNAKYGTAFTRNALIGRASRLGVRVPRRRPTPEEKEARRLARAARHNEKRRTARREWRRIPVPEPEITALRCAGIEPLHVSMADLEEHHCRYPHGEGLGTTYCGHPKQQYDSRFPYCTDHFNLCRASAPASERAATDVSRRIMGAM